MSNAPPISIAADSHGNLIVQVNASPHANVVVGKAPALQLHYSPAPDKATLKGLRWLLPESRSVPLIGREAELANLQEWLDSAPEVGVRCYTGTGGRGKTRLGLALCEQALSSQAWQVGYADKGDIAHLHSTNAWRSLRWAQHTLVVIDYAAEEYQAIEAWLRHLAARAASPAPGTNKLRILLLARYADESYGWYSELVSGNHHGHAKRDLFDVTKPHVLAPLVSGAHRLRVLNSLLTQLSGQSSLEPLQLLTSSAIATELEKNPDAGDPLWLLMTAFSMQLAPGAKPYLLSRAELAMQLARDHEYPHIAQLAEKRGLDGGFAVYLAASITLLQGIHRGDFAALVKTESQLNDVSAPASSKYSPLLADALGVTGDKLLPIAPDLIGEAFVLHVLQDPDHCARAAETVARMHGLKPETVSQSLVRIAQDFGVLPVGACSLQWLEHLVERLDVGGSELIVLSATVPFGSTALRPINQLVSLKLLAGASAESAPEQRARLLNNLAVAEAEMNNREAALDAAQEAADLYRTLAQQRPDAFTPDLAMSLNNLASVLSDLGQREAALDAAQEAADLYRTLAQQRPDAFTPDLAMSLNNLAAFLSALGQREAALDAGQEAADLYRTLALQRPDAFTPDLARSLKVLALRTHEAGGEQAAMAASQLAAEAIGLLTPYFVALPQAHAGLMLAAAKDYIGFCEAAGVAPNLQLLDPLMPIFERLQANE